MFGAHIPETKWESATITTLDERIPSYIQKVVKRDPFSGKPICIACWDYMPDETKGNVFPGLDSGDGFG